MNKKFLILILSLLLGIDILLTFIFVSFFNAIEINPLCNNFNQFILIKIFISIIGIYIINKLQTIPYFKYFILFLIFIYLNVLLFNLQGIVQNF